MPAPAVIPAPIAYINAAAVKKLVVGSRAQVARRLRLKSQGRSFLRLQTEIKPLAQRPDLYLRR